ncbi:helix-loop-helix DNA-binding domain-containing protein [Mucor ambiguus]|uniref:Helix-loop-helix DNA-binding domain-containing protein n=1 Tax=Mucor ambiguus TaxID=91626 RepID=A0A0C9MS97_9FUNG|nr:helix-loop-helix DNA-binding domain-containing protein [Mucor ambiguus]
MFSEEEQHQLQSFLSNLESADTDMKVAEGSSNVATSYNTSTSKSKKADKKRMTPYDKRVRSPSADEQQQQPTSPTSPPHQQQGRSKAGRARKPAHELLSEDQKKANHIASEQKRRANIRIGFDQLVDMVPALDNCHRSEALILQKSVEYIKDLVQDKNNLRERVRELQTALGEIPDEDVRVFT